MYGSSNEDPVTEYYDISFAIGSPDEIPWFLRKAQQYGSPVLDLACGTGRLAIEFARSGLEVFAVDSSEGMLEKFRSKLSSEPASVRNRIHIERQSMTDFSLRHQFPTVVCCDSFFHNLTPEDERACLKAVNKHLNPGGHFLFNIHNNPNPEFLAWASSSEAAKFRKRGDYPIPNTRDTLTVEQALSHDPLNQRAETKLRFQVKDESGNLKEESASSWQYRYLCHYEARYLLELCGFAVQSVVGGYRDEPVTVKSQLAFTARKVREVE